MAAAVGTIVHGPIEDIVGENLTGRDPSEKGWMPSLANAALRNRWEEEKETKRQFEDPKIVLTETFA